MCNILDVEVIRLCDECDFSSFAYKCPKCGEEKEEYNLEDYPGEDDKVEIECPNCKVMFLAWYENDKWFYDLGIVIEIESNRM